LLTIPPEPTRSASTTGIGVGASAPPDLFDFHKRILHEATDLVPADIGVTTRLERGNPAEKILKLVAGGDQDLVVLGSHGTAASTAPSSARFRSGS
jgi:nucleotide-binding universal stress UspA family protein